MGIKLSLPQVNSFFKIYSKKWKYELSVVELNQTIEAIIGAEKYFSSEKEETLFRKMIDSCRDSKTTEGIAEAFKESMPFFSILLLKDSDPFEQNDDLLLKEIFSRKQYFPGMLTVVRESYLSEKIENVHPWMSEIFNSLTAWPSLLVCTPNDFSFINLTFDPIDNQLFRVGYELDKRLKSTYAYYLDFSLHRISKDHSDVIYHISDLHLGGKSSEWRFNQLLRRLMNDKASHQRFDSGANFSVVCTGDVTNNAKDHEFALAARLKRRLVDEISSEIIFLPGNHDSKKIKGNLFNTTSFSKRKLFNEGVRLKFNNRMILVGMDSNIDTALAKGNITEEDYLAYENDFDSIKSNLRSKGIVIGALHHHPVKVEVNYPFQKEWYEKWFGRAQKWAVNMSDIDRLQSFFLGCGTQFVLFGHKHQPHFSEEKGVKYIGCGSSLGYRGFKNEDLVLCYNKITINHSTRTIAVDYVMFRPDESRVSGANRAISRDDHILTFAF